MVWIIFLSRMDVITHTLTPDLTGLAFEGWLQSVPLDEAIPHSELYLQVAKIEARPKPISERTSYIRVRLEFHR